MASMGKRLIGLRMAREIRAWTQAELAALSGYDQSQISRWEHGHPATATATRKLAFALGVTPLVLYGTVTHPDLRREAELRKKEAAEKQREEEAELATS